MATTLRERFRRVLRHEDVRPVPHTVKFTVECLERLRARLGAGFDPVADTGTYVVAAHTNHGWEEVKPGYFRDPFGVVWNKTEDRTLGVVDQPPLATGDLAGFRFPDPARSPALGASEENRRRYPEHCRMLSIGFALFERAWSLVGMEELLVRMALAPDFVHELLDRIAEYNVGLIALAAKRGGIDAVHFGDDWGSQHGPLISPEMWREFVQPRFARMCAAARAAGLLVSLHCCGNVEPLLEDIVACGVDVFDPFQPEAMDIWALRQRFRGRLAFWGGLSVQQTMPYGTPDQVRAETRRLLAEMAPGGGYVLAPAHALTGDVPPENVLAFLEAAREQ